MKILLAMIMIAAGIGLCYGVWVWLTSLLAGTMLEDVGDVIKVSGLFLCLTLLEKLYNLAEKRFPPAQH